MAEDRGAVFWRKSSYSSTGEPNCCEVAVFPGEVRVRDSKRPDDAVLAFARHAWCAGLAWFSVPDRTGRTHE